MHLTATTDTAAPLHINYTLAAEPEADTFDEREYADLCEVVAATHTGYVPLPVTVQMAVTGRYLSHQERWMKEAECLLAAYGFNPQGHPLMSVAR